MYENVKKTCRRSKTRKMNKTLNFKSKRRIFRENTYGRLNLQISSLRAKKECYGDFFAIKYWKMDVVFTLNIRLLCFNIDHVPKINSIAKNKDVGNKNTQKTET